MTHQLHKLFHQLSIRAIRSRLIILSMLSIFILSSFLSVAQALDNPSTTTNSSLANGLVISQVQTGGCANSTMPCSAEQPTGEFVELYNASPDTLEATNWHVSYLAGTGNESYRTELAMLSGSITGHGYILIAHASLHLDQTDQTFGMQNNSDVIAKGGGHVDILDGTGTRIDRVGWGSAKYPLVKAPKAPEYGQSLQRKTDQNGLFVNTGNNATDFEALPTLPPQFGGYTPRPTTTITDGADDPAPNPEDPGTDSTCEGVAISELLPNPAGSDSGLEYIELHNPTNALISLGGCSLQLEGTSKTYPLGTVMLAPDSYLALSDSITGLTLPNSSGGTVVLFNASTDVQTIAYPADLDDDVSWALADGSWATSYTPTPGRPNLITATKPCPEGQSRNTDTNRCVATTGSAGTSAAATAACPAGQERNSETNRCRSISTATAALTPCKEGQERNPETNRCRTATSSTNALQACPAGQERNSETNRCRKAAAAGSGSSSGLNGIKDVATGAKSANKPYKLIIIAALAAVVAYGLYEWRQEIRRHIAKLWVKITSPITSHSALR